MDLPGTPGQTLAGLSLFLHDLNKYGLGYFGHEVHKKRKRCSKNLDSYILILEERKYFKRYLCDTREPNYSEIDVDLGKPRGPKIQGHLKMI